VICVQIAFPVFEPIDPDPLFETTHVELLEAMHQDQMAR